MTPGATIALGLAGLAIPGSPAISTEQLRLAVPGLAGIVGFLTLPMLGAWLRLMLEYLEWNRPGIGRPRRLFGVSLGKAVLLSGAVAFFMLTLVRAAGELRHIQAEEPVVLPSIQGIVVGLVFWAFYGLGLSALRAEVHRHRSERRVTGMLR